MEGRRGPATAAAVAAPAAAAAAATRRSARGTPLVAPVAMLLLLAALARAPVVRGDAMPAHTFAAPFTEVQVDGKRLVSTDWSAGGTAAVNQNFVRLTPDRQSKKGALWSHKPLGVEQQMTATLKFRIHGQGKKFFGDGIAFWIAQQPFWQEGDLHGVSPNFVGVGVAFDTFKNTDHGSRHRDVAVFVNNGKRTREEMISGFEGCDAAIRYHGDRADFSVHNSSRAKFTVDGKAFSVMIDPKGNGNWFSCTTVDLEESGLEPGWLAKAHLGITATTGQLADNHDVLSLHTFDDLGIHPEADELVATPKFVRAPDLPVEERIGRVEDMMAKVLGILEEMQAHGEHQLVAVQDHISNTIRKLQQQEDASEARIAALEREISKSVEGRVEEKLKYVEGSIQNAMAHRVAALETNIQHKVQSAVGAGGAGGWRFPFLSLLIVMGVCMALIYRWYEKLRKSHIL